MVKIFTKYLPSYTFQSKLKLWKTVNFDRWTAASSSTTLKVAIVLNLKQYFFTLFKLIFKRSYF